MFTDNPHATPIWLLIIFGTVATLAPPRIKILVSKYVTNNDIRNLCTFFIMVVIGLITVTLSVLIEV